MTQMGRSYLISVAVVAMLPPGVLYGQVVMQDIIENVRANEGLYHNYEVVFESDYKRHGPPPPPNNQIKTILRKSETINYTRQSEMFRVELRGNAVRVGDASAGVARRASRVFDGSTTKAFRPPVGNIVDGLARDENALRPHMLIMQDEDIGVPLSTYLRGDEAMAAFPGYQADASVSITSEYLGSERLGDLDCLKVQVTHSSSSEGRLSSSRLWLATQRNYLPVKAEGYTYRLSTSIPVGTASVKSWKEVKPGIWFPVEVQIIGLNQALLKAKQERETRWVRTYKVKTVDLSPRHPISYFRDLEFPKGTLLVHVGADGQILKKSVVGQDTPEKSKALFWIGLLTTALAIALACVLFVSWRRARGSGV